MMKSNMVTAAALARTLGLSDSRITGLKAEGLPYEETPHGHRFNLPESVRWYTAHIRAAGRPVATPTEVSPLDAARQRKAEAEARMIELRLAKELGQVVAIDDAVTVFAEHIAAARSQLLAMPSRLAPVLAAEDSAIECEQVLMAAIRDALEELAHMRLEVSSTK
jgi:hypothetical protein